MINKRLQWLFRHHSLKENIVLMQIFLTLIPMSVLSVIAFIYLNIQLINQYTEAIGKEVTVCEQSINRELTLYIQKTIPIMNNSVISTNMHRVLDGDMLSAYNLQTMMNFLTSDLTTSSKELISYTFYMDEYRNSAGLYISPLSSMEYTDAIDRTLQSPVEDIIWEEYVLFDHINRPYLAFYRNISDVFKSRGILRVCLPYRTIEKLIQNINVAEFEGVVVHINKYGHVLYYKSYKSNDTLTYEELDQKDYLWIKSQHIVDQSEILIGIPKSNANKKTVLAAMALLAVTMAFIFLLIIASNRTSNRITKGLTEFITSLKNNEEFLMNTSLINIHESDNDEVQIIKQKFVKLLAKVNTAYKDLINIKNQNNLMEIHLLQARINPHLLYNSLMALKLNAMRNKDNSTVTLIDSMTNYYRFALNNGEEIIEVQKELAMLKEYMKITNYTYMYNHTLQIDVVESIMDKLILKHLLQPVIENALQHGLNSLGRDGIIRIVGYEDEDAIVFEVSDNGFGMNQETIDQLLSLSYKSRRGGYGIKNLIKRIKLYYGETYGISITSEEGKGTTITIRVRKEIEKRI